MISRIIKSNPYHSPFGAEVKTNKKESFLVISVIPQAEILQKLPSENKQNCRTRNCNSIRKTLLEFQPAEETMSI